MARHAANTKVPIAQSRSEIDRILRAWDCDGIRWTDHFKEARVVLEFVWTPENCDAPMLARLEILMGEHCNVDQEWRRKHRVLRVFLMGLFEAVEDGLITLEEAVLPWTVTGDGRTVSQQLLPKQRELPAGSAVALLEG